jgi:DMSO/TMAO reductase YedYZ molybdopterin-dependent catalytic subunit
MKKSTGRITRRSAIAAGLASVGGLVLTRFPKDLPPTYGNLLRMGDTFTYAAQRALLSNEALVKEYRPEDITAFPAIGTTDPGSRAKNPLVDAFVELQRGGFTDWRLPVEGRVAAPRSFSLAELKALPARTQITRHTCEEGWNAIGQWTGVPLRLVLEAAGTMASARFVVFHTFDGQIDSIDMMDALHPQTILAYGMNGSELPVRHGAPIRLRVERQLGYKSLKYLQRIVVSDEFADGGKQGNIQNGWAWYTGI